MTFGRNKHADKDFSIELLPETRREQFLSLFKEYFFFFIRIGLTLFIFGIPFFAAIAIKYLGILPYASSALSPSDYQAFFNTNTLVFDAIYVVCFIIIAIGLAGIFRIIRQLVWGQGYFYMHDLFKGIKQNWGTFVIVAIIFSALHFLSDLFIILNFNIIVNYIPFAIEMLLIPSLLMICSINVIYSKNFLTTFANAIIYCLKRPLTSLAFSLLPLAISFIKFIQTSFIQMILYLILFFLIFPFYILGWYMFSLSGFDKYTNKTYFPDIYHRGLKDEFIKEEEIINE